MSECTFCLFSILLVGNGKFSLSFFIPRDDWMVVLMLILISSFISVCISVFQIVSAVHYCHQKKIVHRDLKVIIDSTAACFFESNICFSCYHVADTFRSCITCIIPGILSSLSLHYHLSGGKPSARRRF